MYLVSISSLYLGMGRGSVRWWCTGSPQPLYPEIPPTQFGSLYFVVKISIISQQNACEGDGGSVGGWYSWQKEPRAAHWFFLFQIKKGTSKLTKMAILRKKGTLGNQWQSLINSRIPMKIEMKMKKMIKVIKL